jgi:hypothetical protein
LPSGDVLERFAQGSSPNPSAKTLKLFDSEVIFSVTDQKGSILIDHVSEKRSSFTTRLRNSSLPQYLRRFKYRLRDGRCVDSF